MTFNFYETKFGKDVKPKRKITNQDVLCVKNFNEKRNSTKWKPFDTSVINDDDIVLIIDGDWLAFSATSNEMVRSVEFEYNGETISFEDCYTGIKKFCEEKGIEYVPNCGVKKHYMLEGSLMKAKGTIRKKIYKAISETKATKVIIFLGSTGNHRDELPLPKLNNKDHFNYKGQREKGWIPSDLPEIKKWLHENWMSHWSVFEEADDSITIAKHSLDKRNIVSYLHGIDKDFNCEGVGGLYIVGHHDSPEWFENTDQNRLGWVKATKTSGGGDKMLGHGDMFLSYQILTSDTADNYSAKDAMKYFGSLKSFGYKGCEKYLMKFETRKDLWRGVLDFFKKHLPESFEYEDCFGVTHKATPLTMLNLYYRCAKMREYPEHIPNVIEDRLKPLGVEYE